MLTENPHPQHAVAGATGRPPGSAARRSCGRFGPVDQRAALGCSFGFLCRFARAHFDTPNQFVRLLGPQIVAHPGLLRSLTGTSVILLFPCRSATRSLSREGITRKFALTAAFFRTHLPGCFFGRFLLWSEVKQTPCQRCGPFYALGKSPRLISGLRI